jgi:hypothetical protein
LRARGSSPGLGQLPRACPRTNWHRSAPEPTCACAHGGLGAAQSLAVMLGRVVLVQRTAHPGDVPVAGLGRRADGRLAEGISHRAGPDPSRGRPEGTAMLAVTGWLAAGDEGRIETLAPGGYKIHATAIRLHGGPCQGRCILIEVTRTLDLLAAEDPVHDHGPGRNDWPKLASVDRLCGASAGMASQPGDLPHWHSTFGHE